jgi:hypothetical protein
MQRVERVGDRMQVTCGQVQINEGVFELAVPEEHLDRAKIRASFQQMRGKTVAPMSLTR